MNLKNRGIPSLGKCVCCESVACEGDIFLNIWDSQNKWSLQLDSRGPNDLAVNKISAKKLAKLHFRNQLKLWMSLYRQKLIEKQWYDAALELFDKREMNKTELLRIEIIWLKVSLFRGRIILGRCQWSKQKYHPPLQKNVIHYHNQSIKAQCHARTASMTSISATFYKSRWAIHVVITRYPMARQNQLQPEL